METINTLQLLRRDDLPKLLDVLKSQFPLSAPAYNWLRVNTAWESKMAATDVQVFCPGGDYRSGGVVALCHGLMLDDQVHMIVYSDEENSKNLAHALMTTTSIPWLRVAHISDVVQPMDELLKPIVTSKNLKFNECICDFYFKSANDVLANILPIHCPDDLTLRRLEDHHVTTVCRNLDYCDENFMPVIRAMVLHNHNMGVFRGDKLLAYMLESQNGGIGMAFTDPEFRGRGYAYLAAVHLSRMMAQDGTNVHLLIRPANEASLAVFSRKLGFGESLGTAIHFSIPVVNK